MKRYIKLLDTYLMENSPKTKCPDVESVLDMLYCCYNQQKGVDTAAVNHCFLVLDTIMKELSVVKASRVIELVCQLCGEYQKDAFKEGMLVGFYIYNELHK